MKQRQKIPEEALHRLGQYWSRAQLMRDHMHHLIDAHEGEIAKVIEAGYEWQLEVYLSFWLSGLFVVVEDFNKLKLKDARVQKLFNKHVGELKELRHETFHFTVSRAKGRKVIRNVNWAEGLTALVHDATLSKLG
jgi:hypothetical protein